MWELWGVEISAFWLTWHIAYTTACCYRTSRDFEFRVRFMIIVLCLFYRPPCCLGPIMFMFFLSVLPFYGELSWLYEYWKRRFCWLAYYQSRIHVVKVGIRTHECIGIIHVLQCLWYVVWALSLFASIKLSLLSLTFFSRVKPMWILKGVKDLSANETLQVSSGVDNIGRRYLIRGLGNVARFLGDLAKS